MAVAEHKHAITDLLQREPEDAAARMEALLPLVYDELRKIAGQQLAREHERYSMCTTALVHDAYLKLVDDSRVSSRGRAYFFAAVAHTMRRILVDRARARNQLKRGGDVHFTALDNKEVPVNDLLGQVIDLDTALARLQALSPRQVQIVECRVFGGLDVAQTAEGLDISPRTVKRDWAVARAWLLRELKQDPP